MSIDFDRWVQMSEVPTAPNLFFLGACENRITFYSQQVRALSLVHALAMKSRLKKNERIAVVGAGVAGLTASAACAMHGCRVDLIEKGAGVIPLQSGSSRLLHPHIYEWPTRGSLLDSATLPFLEWRADNAASIRKTLETSFDSLATEFKLLVKKTDTALTNLERIGEEWQLTLNQAGCVKDQLYDKVIVAIGFGDEKICGDAPQIDYWRDPGPGSGKVELNKRRFFVSGTGDGGLTDLLGVLLMDFEHVQFTSEFLDLTGRRDLAYSVQAAENSVASKGADLAPYFKSLVLPILEKRGIIDHIGRRLRDDRSLVFNANPILGKNMASRLNQVMVYSVVEAAKAKGGLLSFSSGRVTGVHKNGTVFNVQGPQINDAALLLDFDEVIVRHGPDKDARYAPVAAAFASYKEAHGAIIVAHPDWTEPPQLAAETFDYFDGLFSDAMSDLPSKQAREAQAKDRRQRILVSWDRAFHEPMQQGQLDLLTVASKIESLSEPITLVLALPPDKLADYLPPLKRLVLASRGQLRLATVVEHHARWQDISAAVSSLGAFPTPYEPRPLPKPDELNQAVDEMLLRALDLGIQAVIVSGKCPGIGEIHATLTSSFDATWKSWRASIHASPALRSEFLRLLFQVELEGKEPWPGDHGALPGLVAAVVLMLATHLGQTLLPATCSPGNLQFGTNAVALGSGCLHIAGKPIDDFEDPDAWNVDALILAGAREEMFRNAGLISDGGERPTSLLRPERVSPVVITAARKWRRLLEAGQDDWRSAVVREFAEWRDRQDKSLGGDNVAR